MGAKEKARRKKCKVRFSLIKKNKALQKNHMKVGVKKLLRAGMMPARTWGVHAVGMAPTMTMTMTHSEKSHIHRMKAWPYRQECRGHDPTKKNLFCWCSLLVGKVCRYKLLKDRVYRNET